MFRRETGRHRAAFEQWYGCAGNFRRTAQSCTISLRSLYDWARWFDWQGRADRRDAEAAAAAEHDAIRRRAELMERHRAAGEQLIRRGMEHLESRSMESAADAIRAIKTGIEIERQAINLPAWVTEIVNASPDELQCLAVDMEARRQAAFAASEQD